MKYYRLKMPNASCPKCSRKLELLFSETDDPAAENFYICFKCRTVEQFGSEKITSLKRFNQISSIERRVEIRESVESLPSKYLYKANGSQLREKDLQYTRQWLSLAEYGKIFKTDPPSANLDLRLDKETCKWCGMELVSPRRSFCSDHCSRTYSTATFRKRTIAALPYRIACRDRFFCRGTGEDLAIRNKFGQRIPASNGQLSVHHLVFVANGGSDHESNLITLSKEAHQAYHRGEKEMLTIINAIKKKQLEDYQSEMTTM